MDSSRFKASSNANDSALAASVDAAFLLALGTGQNVDENPRAVQRRVKAWK
jgi:hypothetical protein